jgi:PAS domain S-box-containing protein
MMAAEAFDGGWEGLFWLLFRHSSNPIALLDEQRCIVDINDSALTLLERTPADILGMTITDSVIPSERADATRQWEEFMRIGEYTGSRDLLRPDGSTVAVDFAARMASIDGRRLAIYVILAKDGIWPLPTRGQSAAQVLTKREREVVTLIAMGLETDQIAAELHVSPETIRSHVRNAMSKLGAHTRAQLVAIVISSDRSIHVPHVKARPGG